MAGNGFVFELDASEVLKNLEEFTPRLNQFIDETFKYYASIGEQMMKKGAPWRDRTGNARSGLITSTSSNGTQHEIIFAHTVSYGIWLEVRWAGRYAIIEPTIRQIHPRIMSTLKNGMSRL